MEKGARKFRHGLASNGNALCFLSTARLRLKSACFAGVLFAIMLPYVVRAQYLWTTNSGSITITGYTGPGGDITIPDTITGLPVTSIGDSAFNSNGDLSSVTTGTNLVSIGNQSFFNCGSLVTVTIGTNVTSIGNDAFTFCGNLSQVYFQGNYPAVSSSAFHNDPNKKLYYFLWTAGWGDVVATPWDPDIPCLLVNNFNGTMNIGQYVGSAGSVTIPNNIAGYPVVGIGQSAFVNCASMTNVIIPSSVTLIDGGAFYGCANLKNVIIPPSVAQIGTSAFGQCSSLTAMTIPDSVTDMGIQVFYHCQNLQTVKLPEYLTSIASGMFSYCFSLTNVTIPQTVTNIGDSAFYACGIKNITLPNGITRLGNQVFLGCEYLESIVIPDKVTSLGTLTFADCPKLLSIYFKGDAPVPGYYSFDSFTGQTVYYLPGKNGWSPQPAGFPPAVLWNPHVLTADSTFGIQTNRFGFTIVGSTNLTIVVEASTDLASGVWTAISTNTLDTVIGTNGTSYFSDSNWTNSASRFYRFRAP